jgi:hypothetical protein
MAKKYIEFSELLRQRKGAIGLILLVTSSPLAWGGVSLCAFLTAITGNKFFLAMGGIIYAISWVQFFLGVYLAGSEGVTKAKNLRKKIFKRK